MKVCNINKCFLIAASISLLFCLTAFDKTYAESRYIVKKGDTFSKIARKFRINPGELRNANNLNSDKLSVGRKLVLPGKGARSAASAVSKKRTSPAPETETTAFNKTEDEDMETGYVYHRFQKGETLAFIAKKYGLTVRELRTINDLKRKKLAQGQNLIVGNTVNDSDDTGPRSRKIKRIDISGKIEQVKALSESPELTEMSAKDRLLLFAEKMLDLPYKFGANGVLGLDCSSFVQTVYSLIDMPLPRSAREQFKVGEKIAKHELKSGDLLFFRTYARFPSHVGIYIGDNLFIHASSVSKKVRIDSLDRPYYVKRYIGAKRLLDETTVIEETAAKIISETAKQ
jgi:cell wall-associated NlpC family hydrolase